MHVAGRSQLKDEGSARAGWGSKGATAPDAIESSSKKEERSLCMKRSMALESCAGEEEGEDRGMVFIWGIEERMSVTMACIPDFHTNARQVTDLPDVLEREMDEGRHMATAVPL